MYGVLPASPHVPRNDYESSMLVVDAGTREHMDNAAEGGDNENLSSRPTPIACRRRPAYGMEP